MRIFAAQVVEVQRDEGVVDEALEEFVHQVDVELADPGAAELELIDQAGTPGKIDHHP